MYYNSILLQAFIKRNVVLGFFQTKGKNIRLFMVLFLCIPGGERAYMTLRRPIGAPGGRGDGRRGPRKDPFFQCCGAAMKFWLRLLLRGKIKKDFET
jgi:hypothetical protein